MKNPFRLYSPENEEEQQKFDQANKEGLAILEKFKENLMKTFKTVCDDADTWQFIYVKLGASDTQSRECFFSRAQDILKEVADEVSL
jgi:hypothetical protein